MSDPPVSKLQEIINHPIRMQETELRSFARAEYSLNCQEICVAPIDTCFFLLDYFVVLPSYVGYKLYGENK